MANILLPKDDVHLRLGIIKEARAAGLDWLSQAFLIYQKIRWYETDGKFGFMVASSETLGEQFGLKTRQVELILQHLQSKGLIQHIWCDKKVYRNKTKVWMSTARLQGIGTSVEAIKVIGCGKKNVRQLDMDPFKLKKLELLNKSDYDGSESDYDGSESDYDGSESALGEKQGSENKKENKKENKYIYKEISKSSSKFKKPTIEEIKAYCEEKGYQIDPEYFYDYYESIGWKRGKTPIKSWKHTLATWVKNQSSWGKEKEKSSAKREKKKITLDFS